MQRKINEFIFIGLQRSGNHAIINWLFDQVYGNKLFLNYCRPNENPFITSYNGKFITDNSHIIAVSDWHTLFKSNQHSNKELSYNERKITPLVELDYLLHSYEDCDTQQVLSNKFNSNHDFWIGKTEVVKRIIILRSPLNLLASRIEAEDHLTGIKDPRMILACWKEHARHYNDSDTKHSNQLVILYDLWFASKSYRKKILQLLNIKKRFLSLGKVSKDGGGSSFDGRKHENEPQKMKTLERYKKYLNHEYLKIAMKDPDIRLLSKEIFGDIIQ